MCPPLPVRDIAVHADEPVDHHKLADPVPVVSGDGLQPGRHRMRRGERGGRSVGEIRVLETEVWIWVWGMAASRLCRGNLEAGPGFTGAISAHQGQHAPKRPLPNHCDPAGRELRMTCCRKPLQC